MNDICCYMIASSKLGKIDYSLMKSKIISNENKKFELIGILNNLDVNKIEILRVEYHISDDIIELLQKLN